MVPVNYSHKPRGFSLVEVLIALAILMMVLFVGNLAYRTYSVYWHKELGSFQHHTTELRGLLNVHSVIRNIKPMVLKGGKQGGYVYFEGGDSLLRAIGNEAFGNADVASAFELTVVNDSDKSVRLEYREYPITSPVITEGNIGNYGDRVILLRGFEDIRFEYFGWPSYADFAIVEMGSDSVQQANQKIWFGLYSSKDTLVSPEIVKLRLKHDGQWSEVKIPLTHFSHRDLLQFVGSDV